jgi:hypothetical protein
MMEMAWVVNHWREPYVMDLRGEKLVFPANGKKEFYTNRLRAERILSHPKQPARYLPDGFTLQPGSPPPQMLQVILMTEEEVAKVTGKTVKEVSRELEDHKKAGENACAICGQVCASPAGLKGHVTKAHPDYEPVAEKDSGSV